MRVRFEAAGEAGWRWSIAGRSCVARGAARARWCREPRAVEDAVAWLLASIEAVQEALLDLGEPPPPPRRVDAADAVARACGFLRSQDASEDHRWGLFGQPHVAGNLYPLIFKTAALRACGEGCEDSLERLLALRDADGFRYYPGARLIPPDADDTGLVLGYFASQLPPAAREASARQLLDSFEGEGIHTWMGELPREMRWEGDDCLATLANACWGLMESGFGAQVPAAAWARLAREAMEDGCSSPFYPPALTRMFLHRALGEAAWRQLISRADAHRARQRLERHLAGAERLAGNHGDTAQETAAAVLAASAWGLPLRRASLETWLCERQEADGSWAGEPFTRTPGVHLRPRVWGAAGTTTCWVVLALLALRQSSGPDLALSPQQR